MAFEENKACLWHAFNSLDDKQCGSVIKSKLKVLTQNIGSHLGLPGIEKGLETYRSNDSISFLDYMHYLKVELFNVHGDKTKDKSTDKTTDKAESTNNDTKNKKEAKKSDKKEPNANLDFSKVVEVCWMLCSKEYLANRKNKTLKTDDIYRLWCLFNFLSEADTSGDIVYPVVTHIDEIGLIVGRIWTIAGQIFDEDAYRESCEGYVEFRFPEMQDLLEQNCLNGLDEDVVSAAIKEVYDEYIVEVIKKDYLYKKAPKLTSWKERWFLLAKNTLRYYSSRDEKELKGEIQITANCKVQSLPDKSGVGSRRNRFDLVTEGRVYELSAPDPTTRIEWIAALKNSIEQCLKPYSPQKTLCLKRRAVRQEKLLKKRSEQERRMKEREEMEYTKQELQAEKMARSQLQLDMIEEVSRRDEELEHLRQMDLERENLLKELEKESSQREVDKQKLEELEEELSHLNQKRLEEAAIYEAGMRRFKEEKELKKKLEQLLEEEKQAKRDEEIVRRLQAQALEEEMERQQELERAKAAMEVLLKEETQRRVVLEEEKLQQQQLIEHERTRLQAVEKSRLSMDGKLQDAFMRLQDTERAKEAMAVQLAEKQQEQKRQKELRHVPSHRGYGAFPKSKLALGRSKSVDNGQLGRNSLKDEEKDDEEGGER